MAVTLEAALDELYAAKPEDFVATRAALAKTHGKVLGAELKKRRKPTQTAYALNQLARQYPDAIADLVDAGRALARAQRKAMRGDAADVRDAIARQRAVIRERMADVAKLVGKLGVDAAHLPEIASALQAALVDPAIGEELEAGHLEKPPEAPSGFPLLGGGVPVAKREPAAPAEKEAPADRKAPRPKKKDAATEKKDAAAEKEREAAARKRAEAEEKRAKEKRAAEERAAEEARRKARAEATRLEKIAATLADRAKAAAKAADEAAKAAAAARNRADAA